MKKSQNALFLPQSGARVRRLCGADGVVIGARPVELLLALRFHDVEVVFLGLILLAWASPIEAFRSLLGAEHPYVAFVVWGLGLIWLILVAEVVRRICKDVKLKTIRISFRGNAIELARRHLFGTRTRRIEDAFLQIVVEPDGSRWRIRVRIAAESKDVPPNWLRLPIRPIPFATREIAENAARALEGFFLDAGAHVRLQTAEANCGAAPGCELPKSSTSPCGASLNGASDIISDPCGNFLRFEKDRIRFHCGMRRFRFNAFRLFLSACVLGPLSVLFFLLLFLFCNWLMPEADPGEFSTALFALAFLCACAAVPFVLMNEGLPPRARILRVSSRKEAFASGRLFPFRWKRVAMPCILLRTRPEDDGEKCILRIDLHQRRAAFRFFSPHFAKVVFRRFAILRASPLAVLVCDSPDEARDLALRIRNLFRRLGLHTRFLF